MPSGLTALAGNQQILLNWNSSAGATSYDVSGSTTTGGPYTKIASPAVANYTDTGLTNGTTYYYNWVTKAYNSAGDYYFSDYTISEISDSDSAQFIQDIKAAGSNPIMTMVMLDWVCKGDPAKGTGNGQLYSFSVAKYGTQCATNPSTGNGDARNGLKPNPTCSTPANYTQNDPNDANVPL